MSPQPPAEPPPPAQPPAGRRRALPEPQPEPPAPRPRPGREPEPEFAEPDEPDDDLLELDDPPPPRRRGARSAERKQAAARRPVVRRADPGLTPPPRATEQTSQWPAAEAADYDDLLEGGYTDGYDNYDDFAGDHDRDRGHDSRDHDSRDHDRDHDDRDHGDADYDDYDDEYDDYRDYPRYPTGEEERPNRRRRLLFAVGSLLVVVLVGFGVWLGLREFFGIGFADYDGPGRGDVLVRVSAGDSSNDIGERLQQAGVVASVDAFTSAGKDSDSLRSIQPGYYVMKKQMSGQAAVTRITAPSSRVGELQIEPGSRLDDVHQPNGSVTPGVFSKLAKASCATLNGKSTCVSAQTLRATAADTDPAELGVPQWAVADVRKADPARRLEGLIAPDVYQVRPGDDARTLLKTVLVGSVARLQADGLPSVAQGTGFSPYQVLVMASLVQSEAVRQDFGKVSRVTYNRLQKKQKLQYDSTVNYVLDRPEIRTRASDRDRAGPYNTYNRTGLPPTPISAPSADAIEAAVKPDQGNWLYFVKCEKNGLSCFAATTEEHERNIRDAQARGVY